MSAITVYLHYQPRDKEEKTSKISIPAKWTTTKSVADVIELFAKSYNSKNPDSPIVTSEHHLETNDNEKIYSNNLCGTVLGDHSDYFIREGSHESVKRTQDNTESINKLRCKNYGCQQYYLEEDNRANCCCHHTGPPVFHDTTKYWSCCPNRKAYDFESFQAISGCAQGKHSQVNVGVSISASPNATTVSDHSGPALKSISDFNASNPTASTAASAAAKIITSTRKSTRNADGLHAKCQRKGCQKDFLISENNSTACLFHKGQPIFHDAVKFWSCCSDTRCFDFDEFLAVPGCAKGYHDDGVIDLDQE